MTTSIFGWPFQKPDPEKPMCIGVQTTTWGDGKGNYTGGCRYGAPIGPMQAAIRQLDRRTAIGTARENGLAGNFASRLESELTTIAGLPAIIGRNRLIRYADQETRAAEGRGNPAPQPSWIKRATVTCAVFGAVGAETTLLWEVVVNHRLPPKELAKNAAMACALAVITPGVNKWIKSKGFDLEA